MTTLVKILYPLPARRRSTLSLLAWWESRRAFYNLVVGTTGLVTLGGVTLFFSLPPAPDPPPLAVLLVPVAAYGMMANVCYSLGWLAEVLARAIWGDEAPELGPLLFRQGLLFSIGLTLVPLWMAGAVWALRVLSAAFG